MPTTFLAASQELATRLKLSGSGPTAVTNQPREYHFPISCLAKAHRMIVGAHVDWTFLWAAGTVEVSPGGNPHTVSTVSVQEFDEKTFYYQGRKIDVLPWVGYKKAKLMDEEWEITGTPEQVVIRPDKKIIVIPEPAAIYTLDFDCWIKPTELTESDSIIQVPDECMEVLYDLAKMLWQGANESPNYAITERDFSVGFEQMEAKYWPGKVKSSLAEDQEIVVVPE